MLDARKEIFDPERLCPETYCTHLLQDTRIHIVNDIAMLIRSKHMLDRERNKKKNEGVLMCAWCYVS